MIDNDLKTKLQKSEGFNSLLLESNIKSKLDSFGWECLHSPYFEDYSTNKLREIDLVARKKYEGISHDQSQIFSDIVLLIESKSLSNYHIICDSETNKTHSFTDNSEIWMGLDHYQKNKKLIEILNKTELSKLQCKEVIDHFEKRNFPDGFSIFAEKKNPVFKDLKCFSTFRETNIGTTKELDNSVLWKAFQSLNAAKSGYENLIWELIESDLLNDINFAITFKEDLFKILNNSLSVTQRRLINIHKIVVLDAHLWTVNNQSIDHLKYFRLLLRNIHGNIENWIDVVNQDHLDEYLQKITHHYETSFFNSEMKAINY